MPLIKSISGIRGTIGGNSGENLTPIDIVECAAAYGNFIKQKTGKNTIVIGRDARMSGDMVSNLVIQTLRGVGCNVIDLGLSTTPTVEYAVPLENAGGGVICTASHNPRQWNALKFLNDKGEFISAEDGRDILKMISEKSIDFAKVDDLGTYVKNEDYIQKHIDHIFSLETVDLQLVKSKNYKVVVDCINSTGAISIVPLLEQMGCEVTTIFGEMTGDFAHNPEPLPAHLEALSNEVKSKKAHLGISVDPDVDRLAFVSEDGEMFGEEYTLVAIADYLLGVTKGNTVSNLSSTRALRDVTRKHGGEYYASAVGEVNVVNKMKAVNAVIGGEGNGGVIYPATHYGRDAMVGVALFLTHLAKKNCSVSMLKASYPKYFMTKNKIALTPEINVDLLLQGVAKQYANHDINTIDGVKIDLEEGWIHLRKSNTEPIIRIYTEATSITAAENLSEKIKADIGSILKNTSV